MTWSLNIAYNLHSISQSFDLNLPQSTITLRPTIYTHYQAYNQH